MRNKHALVYIGIVLLAGWVSSALAVNADVLFREGYAASMAREWDEAISLYSKALKADPENAEVYFQRAVVYEVTNRLREAISDYEKALQLQSDHYLAMEYLAKLYENEGKFNRAVSLYSRALTLTTNAKWRSILQWWISEAKRKMKAKEDEVAQSERRAPRPARPAGE
jgi:tetratricopeptide (TPR) repeat protein